MILSETRETLDELKSRIRRTRAVDGALVINAAEAFEIRSGSSNSTRINQFVRSAAWTEAALAVVEVALPRWRPRRLACEDGIWRCALSRNWKAPEWLDDAVEADHALLPLAILSAAIDARQEQASAPQAIRTVPRYSVLDSRAGLMCCDNFG